MIRLYGSTDPISSDAREKQDTFLLKLTNESDEPLYLDPIILDPHCETELVLTKQDALSIIRMLNAEPFIRILEAPSGPCVAGAGFPLDAIPNTSLFFHICIRKECNNKFPDYDGYIIIRYFYDNNEWEDREISLHAFLRFFFKYVVGIGTR